MSILTKLKAFFNKPLLTAPEPLASKSQKAFLQHQAKAKGQVTPVTPAQFGKAAAVGIPLALGLESKAVAGVAKKAGAALLKKAVEKPVQTAVGLTVGAPLVAGVIAAEPSLLKELPEKSFKTGKGLVGVIKEHPVATAIVGSLAGGVAGYEAAKAAGLIGGEPDLPKTPSQPLSSPVPLSSQTQVIEAGTGLPSQRRKARRKRKELTPIRINNRNINIIGVRSR